MEGRCTWWAVTVLVVVAGAQARMHERAQNKQLLYILLDGFRWDYVDLQDPADLPGFTRLLREGGRARWTNALFPSLSYPSWTSLVTGQYAETHGIVGNYFYDSVDKDVFSLFDVESTGKLKWWTSEPVWTTAQKAGLRSAQFLWARCDVPIDGVTTDFCEHFVKIPGKDIFAANMERAIIKLEEGFDLVQVYTEHSDDRGHNAGPDSINVTQSVRDLDDVINIMLTELDNRGLTDNVNIVIVSDHGMTDTTPGSIERHELDDYLDASLVENIADKGAFLSLTVPQANVDQVYEQVSRMTGVTAYRHDDIPDRYHYRNNQYIHEIVLVADPGYFVLASNSSKMLPERSDFVYYGAHGYDPDLPDMRGIFFFKGPDFKTGFVIEPIHLVDVYQVLTHVLHLEPQPHNGTWSRVESIFTQPAVQTSRSGSARSLPSLLLAPVVLLLLLCGWQL